MITNTGLDGRSALHRAIAKNQVGVVGDLLEGGADVNVRGEISQRNGVLGFTNLRSQIRICKAPCIMRSSGVTPKLYDNLLKRGPTQTREVRMSMCKPID